MKHVVFVCTIFLLSACSNRPLSDQIAERVLENITGTDISYSGANCPNVKQNCSGGNYEEWLQKNGQVACACNE